MFPFAALQKMNCFHAAICTGGQGLQPAHNGIVYEQIARVQCTDEGSHLSGIQLLPQQQGWVAWGGCVAWHALECLLRGTSQLPPYLCQQALTSVPKAAEAAGSRKGLAISRAYRTENQTLSWSH